MCFPAPVGRTEGTETGAMGAATVIGLMAHSGQIPTIARIKMILLGCGPPTRLTSGFVPKLNHPPAGGNDSPSSLSHSCPVFTSYWDFDSETAIWDSPAWSYDRKRPGRILDRQWNVF